MLATSASFMLAVVKAALGRREPSRSAWHVVTFCPLQVKEARERYAAVHQRYSSALGQLGQALGLRQLERQAELADAEAQAAEAERQCDAVPVEDLAAGLTLTGLAEELAWRESEQLELEAGVRLGVAMQQLGRVLGLFLLCTDGWRARHTTDGRWVVSVAEGEEMPACHPAVPAVGLLGALTIVCHPPFLHTELNTCVEGLPSSALPPEEAEHQAAVQRLRQRAQRWRREEELRCQLLEGTLGQTVLEQMVAEQERRNAGLRDAIAGGLQWAVASMAC